MCALRLLPSITSSPPRRPSLPAVAVVRAASSCSRGAAVSAVGALHICAHDATELDESQMALQFGQSSRCLRFTEVGARSDTSAEARPYRREAHARLMHLVRHPRSGIQGPFRLRSSRSIIGPTKM